MVLQNRVKYFIHNYFDSPSQVPHYYTKRLSYFLIILWQFLHSMQMSSCWGHPNMEDPKSYLCYLGYWGCYNYKTKLTENILPFFIIFKRDLPRTYWLDLVHLVIFFRHITGPSGLCFHVTLSRLSLADSADDPFLLLVYWEVVEDWRRGGHWHRDTGHRPHTPLNKLADWNKAWMSITLICI